MLPPLNAIAADISVALHEKYRYGRKPDWVVRATPYVEAMLEMKDANGYFGIDPAAEVVLKYLKESHTWDDSEAQRIRRLLRQHVYNAKEKNASH